MAHANWSHASACIPRSWLVACRWKDARAKVGTAGARGLKRNGLYCSLVGEEGPRTAKRPPRARAILEHRGGLVMFAGPLSTGLSSSSPTHAHSSCRSDSFTLRRFCFASPFELRIGDSLVLSRLCNKGNRQFNSGRPSPRPSIGVPLGS